MLVVDGGAAACDGGADRMQGGPSRAIDDVWEIVVVDPFIIMCVAGEDCVGAPLLVRPARLRVRTRGGIRRVVRHNDLPWRAAREEAVRQPQALPRTAGGSIRFIGIGVEHEEMDWPADDVVVALVSRQGEVVRVS